MDTAPDSHATQRANGRMSEDADCDATGRNTRTKERRLPRGRQGKPTSPSGPQPRARSSATESTNHFSYAHCNLCNSLK